MWRPPLPSAPQHMSAQHCQQHCGKRPAAAQQVHMTTVGQHIWTGDATAAGLLTGSGRLPLELQHVGPELQHADGNNVQPHLVVRIELNGTWDTALLGTAHPPCAVLVTGLRCPWLVTSHRSLRYENVCCITPPIPHLSANTVLQTAPVTTLAASLNRSTAMPVRSPMHISRATKDSFACWQVVR